MSTVNAMQYDAISKFTFAQL